MKKFSLMMMGLVMALVFTSCEKITADGPMVTQQRNVANFSGIDLRVSGDVIFRQEPEYKVEVRAQDEVLDVLETYVSGDKLVIKFRNGVRVWRNDGITVTVSGPQLKSLRVSGSGDIRVQGAVHTQDLEMDISGSGDITMDGVTAKGIDGRISGSGSIRMQQGSADHAELKISGSGDFHLANVVTRNASIRTSGSGDTRLHVTERLDVNIAGSGSVYYSGNPVVNASVSGSGKVRHQ